MELWPALRLGWLNGWLLLAGFYAVFGALLLVFPREVVARLYAFPRFTRKQLMRRECGEQWEAYCRRTWRLVPYVY